MRRILLTDDQVILSLGANARERARVDGFVTASHEEIETAREHASERRTVSAWAWYISARILLDRRRSALAELDLIEQALLHGSGI